MSDCPVPTENPIILNLTSSSGALLVGSFLSCTLWGASSIQAFLYFMNYESDTVSLKIMVATLWVLDTANQILVLKSNWLILIQEYGRISNLDVSQPDLLQHTWVEAMVVFAVQLYFIRRIWLFNKKTVLFPICLILLSSWQLVGIVVYLILGYGRPLTNLSTPREIGVNMSLRAAAFAVDVAVTISMVYLLTRQGTPKFVRSKRMMHRLVTLVVNSGMITALFAFGTLVLLAAQPNDLYYTITELPLCSLYFSTFLANLNARHYVRGQGNISTFSNITGARDTNTLVLETMGESSKSSGGHHSLRDVDTGIQIQIDTDTKVDEPNTLDTFSFRPSKTNVPNFTPSQ